MGGPVGKHGPLVASIDQGTSSGRFIVSITDIVFCQKTPQSITEWFISSQFFQVFSANTLEIAAQHQIPISLTYPQEGWVEQDPNAILDLVNECISKGVEKLEKDGCHASDIVAVGVTNQRESVVAWDKKTGKALYNVIGKFM